MSRRLLAKYLFNISQILGDSIATEANNLSSRFRGHAAIRGSFSSPAESSTPFSLSPAFRSYTASALSSQPTAASASASANLHSSAAASPTQAQAAAAPAPTGLAGTSPPLASTSSPLRTAASFNSPLASGSMPLGPMPSASGSAAASQPEFGHDELFVDTLHMLRTLESSGLSREQSELLTRYLTALLIHQKHRITSKFVEKEAVTRATVDMENRLTSFRTEMTKSLDIGLQNVSRDVQQAKSDVQTLKAETRFEHEKMMGNLRLDFNIEKGRLREDVKRMEDLVQQLESKILQESQARKSALENEVQAMRTLMEANKSDLIKWLLGIATTMIGLAFSATIVFFRVVGSAGN